MFGGRPGNSTMMKKKARQLNNLLKLLFKNPIFTALSNFKLVIALFDVLFEQF